MINKFKKENSKMKKSIIIGLGIIIALAFSSCQKPSPEPLFLIKQNGKFGFIDKTGKIKIEPKFELAGEFNEGLAVVKNPPLNFLDRAVIKLSRKRNKPQSQEVWVYINQRGKIAIRSQFDSISAFSDGLARVRLRNQYGYINQRGRLIIKPQFDRAEPFYQGIALVSIGGLWGYIDKSFARSQKFLIEPQFEQAGLFSEALAPIKADNKWGYVDKNFDRSQKFAIEPEFEFADIFSDGLAPVLLDKKWAYINQKGEFVIPAQFPFPQDAPPNFIRIKIGKDWFFKIQNRLEPYPLIPLAGIFSDGLARALINQKYGFIDHTGKIIIPAEFDYATEFSEGLSLFRTGIQLGYIDKTGKILIKKSFDYAYSFHNGLAMVYEQDRLGYIDQTGKFVWKPTK